LDLVIATGETHSVKEFCTLSFKHAGIILDWQGDGLNEIGRNSESGEILIKVDPKYFRPTEVELLIGNPAKAEQILGWRPEVKFSELVKIMTLADMKSLKGS
jgi:GDPmannose 4,6-dehydratase